jgi:Protein of unknown function (DUF1587)
VDLRPTRAFPADGAAGEGFINAAEALTDISPALFSRYLDAAKDIAQHAVLLNPRTSWTSTVRIRSPALKRTANRIGGSLCLPLVASQSSIAFQAA